MMPNVGANTPACVNQPWPILCRSFIALDLGVQRLLQRFGVGAVDRELDALAEERVFDALRLFLEREQALGAGAVGEHDDLADRLHRRVVLVALHRLLDVLRRRSDVASNGKEIIVAPMQPKNTMRIDPIP